MIKQLTLIDETTGELITHQETKVYSRLGSDFFVIYDKQLAKLLELRPEPAVYETFLTLCTSQSFDTYIITTIKDLAGRMKRSYKTVWSAVKWLKENKFIIQTQYRGANAFIINPALSTRGKASLAEKRTIWSMSFSNHAAKPSTPDVDIEENQKIDD